MKEPPIQCMPGDGFTTRIYNERPELARKHLRRRYQEGVQLAFQYFKCDATVREGVRRLFQSLALDP